MKKALFAGSFDPPTRGHLDLVRRSAALFDELVIGVGFNPTKRGRFPVEQRIEFFKEMTRDLDNVRFIHFTGLVAQAARAEGCMVLVRGIRGVSDMDLETRNAHGNRGLTGIETLLLVADPAYSFVSSSLVKEIHKHGGDVTPYVSNGVVEALNATRETTC